jgi:hypothetical protein
MSARKAFPLRVNPELYEELRKWAEAEFRSVNGQIEFLLQQAVRERTGKKNKGRADDRENDPVD